jgi:RimJ/RimL family protein N-acetyltransferase
LSSFNAKAIPWHEHEAWFGAKLNSSTCRMWIMQIGDLPVGQIRYDRVESWEGPSAEISFSMAPGFRGMGLGTKLLEATAELAAQELAVRWLKGLAFSSNQASRRAFLNARFDARENCIVGAHACTVFRRACAVALRSESHVPFH